MKQKKEKLDVMVGYGELATFERVNKGDLVMTRYGNIVEAGLTREEERQRIEDELDDILYSKPTALMKKIQRKMKK
jgi:hypothetical protein